MVMAHARNPTNLVAQGTGVLGHSQNSLGYMGLCLKILVLLPRISLYILIPGLRKWLSEETACWLSMKMRIWIFWLTHRQAW